MGAFLMEPISKVLPKTKIAKAYAEWLEKQK